jgi:mitochondrial cardiolipin hydrolase
MPQRQNKDVINQIVGKLFEVAEAKMKDDSDKAVL